MNLTANEIEIITKAIADVKEFGFKSYYIKREDVLIRISDHMPNTFNFRLYNEEV